MQQATRVAKNTGFLYARMAITVFISLYATRLVLDALGATDFGIFNVIAGAIAMLTFLNAAMASATQRFMSYAEGKGDFQAQVGIFNVSVALHIIIGLFVVLILEIAAYYLFDGILQIPEQRMYAARVIFQCMVFSTFFKIISVPYDAVINAHENMLLVAILGVIEALLKLSIALYITITKFDALISYGFLMALMAVLLLLMRWVYCHRTYEEVIINIRKYYDPNLFKEMGSFASWSFLGSSSSIVANYGQGIVLNVFFGARINAAQGIANQIGGQLGAFSTTMLSALNPTIAKNEGAGNRSFMLKMTAMGSKIAFFLLTFMSIPVLVEMPYILKLWLKNVPEYAIIFCRLLLIRNLIEQISIPINTSIYAVGNIKELQVASTFLNILPLGFSYILFSIGYPPYFLYYVFIGYAFVNGTLILWYAKKYTGIIVMDFVGKVVLRCFAVLFIGWFVAAIPTIFMQQNIFRLVLVIMLGFISTVLLVYFIGLNRQERVWAQELVDILLTKMKNKFSSKKV